MSETIADVIDRLAKILPSHPEQIAFLTGIQLALASPAAARRVWDEIGRRDDTATPDMFAQIQHLSEQTGADILEAEDA